MSEANAVAPSSPSNAADLRQTSGGIVQCDAAVGMISLTAHQEVLQKQQEVYEKRYNGMQQSLRSEIRRLTDLLSAVKNLTNAALPQTLDGQESFAGAAADAAIAASVAAVADSSRNPMKTTPRETRKRKAPTTTPAATASSPTPSECSRKRQSLKQTRPTRSAPEQSDSTIIASRNDTKWNIKYNELVAYKDTHGDINVTRAANPKVYNWIVAQRTEHRLLRQGKASLMRPERIQLLDKIPGWQWIAKTEKPRDWDTRFQQLLEFQKEHGHTNVPQICPEYPKLGNFVLDQRRVHKARTLRGVVANSQTLERIAKLDAIGFVWSLRNRGGWRNNIPTNNNETNDDNKHTADLDQSNNENHLV